MPVENSTLKKLEEILVNTVFDNLENNNGTFLDCVKILFVKNPLAMKLVEEVIGQLSNFQLTVVDDDKIPTFGVCTPGKWPTISIRNSLNAFEKVMILVFELCNLCNTELSNIDIKNYDSPQAYAIAKEQAEFISLERAQNIYNHGRKECEWPEADIKFTQMKVMLPLLYFAQEDYLKWSTTPQPLLNGFIHSSIYTNQYSMWKKEPRRKRATYASNNEEILPEGDIKQTNQP